MGDPSRVPLQLYERSIAYTQSCERVKEVSCSSSVGCARASHKHASLALLLLFGLRCSRRKKERKKERKREHTAHGYLLPLSRPTFRSESLRLLAYNQVLSVKMTMLPKTRTLLFTLICIFPIAQLPLSSCEEEQPTITHISTEQIKEIGQEAEFNCTVANAKNYSVLWIKLDKYRSDKITLTYGHEVVLKGNKFNVTYDNANSTYSLKIKNLLESDTGFYECQILISLEKKVSRETSLQIRRAPTINLNVTRIANVTEGEPFELTCTADGFPVPRMYWKRENDELLPFGGIVLRHGHLRIKKSHRDDRGIYTCVAENDVGPQDQVNATVYIRFKPVTTAVRPRVGQAKGYRAQLQCRVESYPPPKIYWYHNGTLLYKNDFTDNVKANHEYVGTYTIDPIYDDHYGEYFCKSNNSLGASKARLQLFETIVPVCVGSC